MYHVGTKKLKAHDVNNFYLLTVTLLCVRAHMQTHVNTVNMG